MVEVTDPWQTKFKTQAWIAWKGDQPGDYLTKEISLDLTKQPLEWTAPRARLRLDAGATVVDKVVTYFIYPRRLSNRRMWDLRISVPLPDGTHLLSTQAPAPFMADFDGREVSFSAVEFEQRITAEPLMLKISVADVQQSFVTTHAWAVWKNVGRSVGRSVAPQETIRSGDIVIQPHSSQQVAADPIGDVPFATYDLTSLAVQQERANLKATFYTVSEPEPKQKHLEFIVYLDTDCRPDTGAARGGRGAEYWIRYKQAADEAWVYRWDETERRWREAQPIEFQSWRAGKIVSLWVPNDYLDLDQQLCWAGRLRNRSKTFEPSLPSDWLGRNPRLTQFNIEGEPLVDPTAFDPADEFDDSDALWGISTEADSELRPPPLIEGRLAIPLFNAQGLYDVHIFSLPDGQNVTTILNARQPNFRPDGERLLFNSEGLFNNEGGQRGDFIFEYDLAQDTAQRVSDRRQDAHPFYDPWGNRVVYGNNDLALGTDGSTASFIFVQCGLLPPHQETDPRCRELPEFGVLAPAGHMSELRGSHPVWANNELIAYNGCNSWAGFAACGIYVVPASSTKGFSDGLIPQQLTQYPGDLPSDARADLIAFTSLRDGDREAYLMNLSGEAVRNLSRSPTSNDGLPTLSPDGAWAAFVSDREGGWAIWATPISGGPAQKLFNLPDETLWGSGDHSWTNERISWGVGAIDD